MHATMIALLALLACSSTREPPPQPSTEALAALHVELEQIIELANDGKRDEAYSRTSLTYSRVEEQVEPWMRHTRGKLRTLELEYAFAQLQHQLQTRRGDPQPPVTTIQNLLAELPPDLVVATAPSQLSSRSPR